MTTRARGVWNLFPGLGLGLALVLGAGSVAAEIYTWRLDDGSYAFTDDEKAIPPRYRDRVEVRGAESLEGYKRFTAQDDVATRSYESRLERRLDYLRAVNTTRQQAAAAQVPVANTSEEQVTFRTGAGGGSSVEISNDGSGEPIVVETVMMRPEGSAVAQPVRVTRRGNRIVSVEKPRRREWNILDDVYDEADLDRLLE